MVIVIDDSVLNKMTYCEKEIAVTLKNLSIEWHYEQSVFVWDEEG
jgi:hypothetical protein